LKDMELIIKIGKKYRANIESLKAMIPQSKTG
jgi:hypothetical protein